MADLVERLAQSGDMERAGFLNDIIAQLWPNINVAGGRMVKDIVEPMFASMLPGPLAGLRFTKIDLGSVPLVIAGVDVHKTDNGGIKLDMDIVWEGQSDIELDAKMVPKIGIEKVHLKGRLSVLLAPLTNVIPLIGAAQVAFINEPSLELDFTDAADIADSFLIAKTIRKCIMNVIASMAVLPNRYLVKLDANNDFFKTYLPPVGSLRLTIVRATGIKGREKSSGVKRFIEKIVKDVPDCFCTVAVGAGEKWKTSVKKDDPEPEWNETHDFLVADHEQDIFIDLDDKDLMGNDDIGIGRTTVRELLLQGGEQELRMTHNGEPTDATVVVRGEFLNLVDDTELLSSAASEASGEDDGRVVGLATVLVASLSNLQGQRDELQPSLRVVWGDREHATPAKSYSPGTDIFNPSFDQAFSMPVTAAQLAGNNSKPFRLVLLNKKDEVGSVEIPFDAVAGAPDMAKEDDFDLGSGVSVRARIVLRALRPAE